MLMKATLPQRPIVHERLPRNNSTHVCKRSLNFSEITFIHAIDQLLFMPYPHLIPLNFFELLVTIVAVVLKYYFMFMHFAPPARKMYFIRLLSFILRFIAKNIRNFLCVRNKCCAHNVCNIVFSFARGCILWKFFSARNH